MQNVQKFSKLNEHVDYIWILNAQINAECLNDYWMNSECFSVGLCMLK